MSGNSVLKIINITKTFEGICALDQVSFEVQKGCIKAIIGPNGAGKTTLLNTINGITKPDSGKIFFNNQEITRMKPHQIARLGISRTFQLVRLFTINNATVLDNVMIGAHLHLNPGIIASFLFRKRFQEMEKSFKKKAFELLELVGLSGMEGNLPVALPFGNKRLVELARALMTDPQILLLDEPASGLNETEVENFKNLLLFIKKKGVTLLLVEHNMKLVMDIADEIVVLDFGRKIADGSPSEIISNPEVVRAYLGIEEFKC